MDNQCKVTIIDAICGSGKTSWAIDYMNTNTDKKFIYITPYLTEVQRVLDGCFRRAFYEPKTSRGEGSKLKDFNKLLSQGKNIVSTHSLFAMVNDDTLKYLKENDYFLKSDFTRFTQLFLIRAGTSADDIPNAGEKIAENIGA